MKKWTAYSFFVIAITFIVLGLLFGEIDFIRETATYGNFDVERKTAWVEQMKTGITDLASKVVYSTKENILPIKTHPLWAMGTLFCVMLILAIIANSDLLIRKIMQWSWFVIARIGVFRVSGVCPVQRTELGVFPFLNCQACEMASGACPIGMIQWSLINGQFPYFVVGVITLSGLMFGRAICGWMCPFGFFLDLLDRFIFIKKMKAWIRPWKTLTLLKYGILVFVCSSFLWTTPLFCTYLCQAANIYGYWPYYLTIGLSGFKEALTGNWTHWIFVFHLGSSILLFVLAALLGGRWFCKYLCPLGAFFGLFNSLSIIKVQHIADNCDECGKCTKACPMQCDLSTGKFVNSSGCIRCGRCVSLCKSGGRIVNIKI